MCASVAMVGTYREWELIVCDKMTAVSWGAGGSLYPFG